MLARDIEDRRFATAFRGYDPAEVRQFLTHVAGLYGDMQAKVAKLTDGEVVAVLAPLTDRDTGDVAESSTGEERTSSAAADTALADAQRNVEDLLAAARSEAQTIVSRANDEAARIVLRSRAESRGKPSAERNAAIEAALAEIPGDPEQAREQARLMISEARAVRERILADLAKRRRTAHVQLEQLRVAREKLLETLRDARRVVENASRDLSTAEVEARLAAETAGRRVAGEAMPSTDELEAELFGGRYAVSPRALADEIVSHEVVDEVVTETVTVEMLVVSTTSVDAIEGTDDALANGVVATDRGVGGDAQALGDAVEVGPSAAGPARGDAIREDVSGTTTSPVGVVDDLFARLRAERTQAADAARNVLTADVVAAEAPPKAKKARAPRAPRNGTVDRTGKVEGTSSPTAGPTDDTVLVIDVTGDAEADDDRSDDGATTSNLGTDPTDIATLVAERLARSIKRHLRDEQGSALVALRMSRGLPSVDSIVGTDTEQHSRLTQVVAHSLADAGASLHLSDLGPAVDDIVGDVRSSLATALELVRAGSAEAADLPEAIASAYRGWTTERLDALLRRVAPVAA